MTREEPEKLGNQVLGSGFWRLWASSGLSNLADGAFKVALPLVAIRFTDSPVLIAGLALALSLPWLLFALQAGALADRVDRRWAMLGANIARASLIAVLVLAAGFGVGSIWVLYVVAFCVGIAETVYDTSAQSILPQLVSRDLLSRANGRLYAVELTANQFLGPPLGGLLVAVGTVVAFAAPAALWLAAVGALLLVRGNFRIERGGRTTMRADIAEGLRFLWRHRILRTLAIMTGVFNLASNAMFAVFVLYAVGPRSAMGLTDPLFGVLLTATAAGSLVGSFLAERVERRLGRSRSLMVGIIGAFHRRGGADRDSRDYRQSVRDRRRLLPRWSDDRDLERDHGVTAPTDLPRPPAWPGQQRLPPAGLGHHAARCGSRRGAGAILRAARGLRHRGHRDAGAAPAHADTDRSGAGCRGPQCRGLMTTAVDARPRAAPMPTPRRPPRADGLRATRASAR